MNDQDVCKQCGNTREWHRQHRPRHQFKLLEPKPKSFAEMLRELSTAAEVNKQKEARAEATDLVNRRYKQCLEEAKKAAHEGRRIAHYRFDPPQVIGLLVSRQVMIDELLAFLAEDGLQVSHEEQFNNAVPGLSNRRVSVVTMEW